MKAGKVNLLAGLLAGYTQARDAKKDKEEREEMKKLQIKMFKKQLDYGEKEEAAMNEIFGMLKGVPALGPDEMGPPAQTQKKSLLDILADPMGQQLLLQSGTKPETIINMQAYGQMMGGPKDIPEGFELQGVKYDTKGRPMFDYGKSKLDEPVSPSASAGYVDAEGNPALPGMTMRQMQEAGLKPKGPDISPAESGKIAALSNASQYVSDLSAAVLDPNLSKTDRAILLTNMAAATPKTKGRELHFKVRDAIDAVFRARTGSAAPESEAAAIIAQFMPSPFDTDEGIKDKLKRFDKFVGGSFDIITLPENVRRKLEAGNSTAPSTKKVVKWNDLPAGE